MPYDPHALVPGKLPGPLLERLINAYRTREDPDVTVTAGYGRDAAAISVGDTDLIIKSDPITFATDAAARYLVAVNANDVACMGGIPRWMTVVALLPPGSSEALVERQFADLQTACNDVGIAVVGGHTEVTDAVSRPVLIGTLVGVAPPPGPLRPGGAQVGDALYLTKWAGIEGTALLARELTEALATKIGPEVVSRAAKLLRTPGISIVREAVALRPLTGVTAMHDPTEGGVATAIHELVRAAGLGVEVLHDAIPVLPETIKVSRALGLNELGLLASGALLFTAHPDAHQQVLSACREERVRVTRIGTVLPTSHGLTMITDQGREPLPRFDADEVTRALA